MRAVTSEPKPPAVGGKSAKKENLPLGPTQDTTERVVDRAPAHHQFDSPFGFLARGRRVPPLAHPTEFAGESAAPPCIEPFPESNL